MKKMMRFLAAALLAATLTTSAFAQDKAKAKDKAKAVSLYTKLGAKKGITAVVDDFVAKVAADKRINGYFKATAADPGRLARFKSHLVDQICQASGGPCKYTGKDMRTAHAGMGIKGADFDALVEDLTASLDKFKVGGSEQQTLLNVLGPMKKDIVEKQ